MLSDKCVVCGALTNGITVIKGATVSLCEGCYGQGSEQSVYAAVQLTNAPAEAHQKLLQGET